MLALLFGVFWGTRYYYTWDAVSEEERSTVLLERIKTVAKLVTVEGYFSEVYDYKSYWGYDFSPFRKKALVRVKARVSVGYDLDQMKIEAQADRKRILIRQGADRKAGPLQRLVYHRRRAEQRNARNDPFYR